MIRANLPMALTALLLALLVLAPGGVAAGDQNASGDAMAPSREHAEQVDAFIAAQ